MSQPPASTRVAIAGGGPAGLVLALELGRRGVPCVVLETETEAPAFPKANATTSRTMEHFRRLGFSAEIRALGLPGGYPQDIAYFTRYGAYELARVHWPSRGEAEKLRAGARDRWPTPEPLHRVQQMYVEGVLRKQVAKWPSVSFCVGWRLEGFSVDDRGVRAEITDLKKNQSLQADYLVGCEGPRSVVRKTLGIEYQGWAGEERDFFGGRMLAVYFRSPEFYRRVRTGPAWQYWAINRGGRGLVCAIDGEGLFVLYTQLARDAEPTAEVGLAGLWRAMGGEFPIELLGTKPWIAGHTLVVDRYGDAKGRVFLAGDAAHLFTPTGGQGYNTAVDDAANLGWKLAAVCQGWGGPQLLASYQAERKPIGERNTRFARAMADSIGRIPVADDLEQAGASGERSRVEIGAKLLAHCNTEFDVPGIHLGVHYGGSSIVADGVPPAADNWHSYMPTAMPGARAPHCWLSDNVSILDRLGRDFTLLRFNKTLSVKGLEETRLPLAVQDISSTEARDLYGADLVLVRPDHHVAWRGNALPADPAALVNRVVGFPLKVD